MFEIGRLCVKIAGRDAGKKCVIIDVFDKNFVLIDGETRRRKCNINHLEPLKQVLEIKQASTHEEVTKLFEAQGIKARNTKPKQEKKQTTKKRKTKPKQVKKEVKTEKKEQPKQAKTEVKNK